MSEIKPLARRESIVLQELESETLVYDLNLNKALVLNKTSAIVWQLCDGKKTITEIAEQMAIKSKELVTEDFVYLALDELKKVNLIENESIKILQFNVLSRREMVKKIGFASMIALPVISTLVAPQSINAASLCFPLTNNANQNPLGCPCDSNSDCLNPNACCGVAGGAEICVSLDATPVGSPCRGNCECAGTSTCPSCTGFPRICRIGACPPFP